MTKKTIGESKFFIFPHCASVSIKRSISRWLLISRNFFSYHTTQNQNNDFYNLLCTFKMFLIGFSNACLTGNHWIRLFWIHFLCRLCFCRALICFVIEICGFLFTIHRCLMCGRFESDVTNTHGENGRNHLPIWKNVWKKKFFLHSVEKLKMYSHLRMTC